MTCNVFGGMLNLALYIYLSIHGLMWLVWHRACKNPAAAICRGFHRGPGV